VIERSKQESGAGAATQAPREAPVVGKRSLAEQLAPAREATPVTPRAPGAATASFADLPPAAPGGLGDVVDDFFQARRIGAPIEAEVPAGAGAGEPLPDELRAAAEAGFGHDFSAVRVHEDGAAEQVGAEAFARGDDLHFAAGRFDADGGRDLIGHELAHVVQQRSGRVTSPQARGGEVVDAGLEAEADLAGAAFARGAPVAVATGGASTVAVQYRRIGVRGRGTAAVQSELAELSPRQLAQIANDTAEQLRAVGFEFDDAELAALRAEAAMLLQQQAAPPSRRFNMASRADEDTGMNLLLAAAQPDLNAMDGVGSGYQGPVDEHSTVFNPESRNPAPRSDLGRTMARDQGMSGRLPATTAASGIQPGLPPQQWLHRHGHGLGGMDTADNVASGSEQANTEMIPVESAVAGRGDLMMQVTFQQQTGTYLIHRIQMRVYNQETGDLVFQHDVDGQSRVFTRQQYDQLGLRAREAMATDVMEVRADYPQISVAEAQAVLGLLGLRG
jgi:hypothetical protein